MVLQLLRRIGIATDPEPTASTVDVPDDVFESRRIGGLHDRLLGQFGLGWQDAQLTRPLPDVWWRRAGVAAIRSELVRIVRSGLSEGRGLWAFNDPRTVRFLPLWHEVFAEVGAKPSWILSARHPVPVIESLALSSNLPRERCELLWIEHNLDALAGIAPRELVVVSFQRLLADPAGQLRRLLRRLPFLTAPPEAELAAIAGGIADASRVHRGNASGCTGTAAMIHDWLEAMAGDRTLPDAVPGHIAATAARDLAWLVDRERANAGASKGRL